MRNAVIDLGTNTFHLLIAEPGKNGAFHEIYRERSFVKLAEEGIERIGATSFQRGIDTLVHFSEKMREFAVDSVRAIGTAALRTADNGEVFVRQAELAAGVKIELIHGREEARLISQGVLLAIPPSRKRFLIMDIGGGSVEFIIAGPQGVYWAESFPIGVAVLYRHFHRSEPIAESEVRRLITFLDDQLGELIERLAEYPTDRLVGAAGTFDVVANLLGTRQLTPNATLIDLSRFRELYFPLLSATREERLAMPEVPPERADMIVVALILIQRVLELMGARTLLVSRYSMKEGALGEMR